LELHLIHNLSTAKSVVSQSSLGDDAPILAEKPWATSWTHTQAFLVLVHCVASFIYLLEAGRIWPIRPLHGMNGNPSGGTIFILIESFRISRVRRTTDSNKLDGNVNWRNLTLIFQERSSVYIQKKSQVESLVLLLRKVNQDQLCMENLSPSCVAWFSQVPDVSRNRKGFSTKCLGLGSCVKLEICKSIYMSSSAHSAT